MIDRVIVFDVGYYQHRAILCEAPGSSPTYLFLSMILGNLRIIGATLETQVIMAMDSGKSWRKLEDRTYKAQRAAGRAAQHPKEWWTERYEMFNKFLPTLSQAMPWQFIQLLHMEADDVAATACKYYSNIEVILCSADKDWQMLAKHPNVRIFSPLRKKTGYFVEVDNADKILLEKIQGDKSDNLLTKPQTEKEFEQRKRIVDLITLPPEIEKSIWAEFDKTVPKKIYFDRIPFPSLQERARKLYEE